MIAAMAPGSLNRDTSPDIERMQIEAWRRMTPEQKAAIVTGLTRATFNLTLAGIRHRHPEASPHEQRLRLALITLGGDLARRAFPEIAALDSR
jgi:hypothetical protein